MLMFSLSIGRLAFLISVPIFVLIISTIIVAKIAFKLTQVKSDENRSVEEIVTSRGFRFEDHEITTADGYLLHMFRVMNPHTPDNVRIRKPVLLMHGLGTHALIFLLNDEHGPMYKRLIDPHDPLYKFKKNGANNHAEDALAFELAARGYDVWLGNQRGNRFSNKHAYLDPVRDSAKYWNFSFDEIAMFDLPALIDHVLRETGQEKLSYISLSQGSTIMFALMSSQPKYNQLIRPFIAIAPVISTKHSQLICGFGKTIINWAPCFALRSVSVYQTGLHDMTVFFPPRNNQVPRSRISRISGIPDSAVLLQSLAGSIFQRDRQVPVSGKVCESEEDVGIPRISRHSLQPEECGTLFSIASQ